MKNRSSLVFVALLCGVASGSLAFIYQKQAPKRVVVKSLPTTSVVVATRDIPVGDLTVPGDFKVVKWPQEALPEGSVSKSAGLVGRTVRVPINSNEPITDKKLAPADAGTGLIALVPTGMRALTVKVSDALSPFVTPGVRIDLIGNVSGGTSRVIMQNVQVIAVGKSFQPGKRDEKNNNSITLLVTPAEVEVLALASQEAQLQIALRNNADEGEYRTQGARLAAIFTSGEIEKPTARPVPPPPPPAVQRPRQDTVETFRREKKSVTTLKPGS